MAMANTTAKLVSIVVDMVSDIRCDMIGDIYGHEALADRIADHIAALEKKIAELLQDAKKLYALEAHGVDNWDGYDFAMDDLDDE